MLTRSRHEGSGAPLVVLLTLALAGCGGGSHGGSTTDAKSPPATTSARTAASVPSARCPEPIAAAVARAARAPTADARPVEQATDVVTCAYRAGALRVRVTVDEAPQAATRFARTVVETGQAHLGDGPAELPQMVRGVGVGANWFAARRELLATAGDRLVTLSVTSRADRDAAIAIARAALR